MEKYKWLWGETLTYAQRDKLFDKILEDTVAGVDLETLKWLWGENLTYAQRDKIVQAMSMAEKNRDIGILRKQKISATSMKERNKATSFEYDIFICHASEDKESFVRGLAEKLSGKGLRVRYDEFTLSLGDNLRRSIDYGLANSRYGVVVLSKKFFEKEWPQKELDGLVAREDGLDKVILPIWHGVTKKQVQSFSPILADRLSVPTDKGVDYVVNEILTVFKRKSV